MNKSISLNSNTLLVYKLALGTLGNKHRKRQKKTMAHQGVSQWWFNPLYHLEGILPVGYKMMVNMGWEEGKPLGIRGEGILEPISQKIKCRLNGDVRGLGFSDAVSFDTSEEDVRVKITRVSDKFGVGTSEFGAVFIPRGALKHLTNISGCLGKEMLGLSILAKINRCEGSFDWRVANISNIIHEKSLIRFVGYNPRFPDHSVLDFESEMRLFDQCFP
jgi:hypothetical protein